LRKRLDFAPRLAIRVTPGSRLFTFPLANPFCAPHDHE
jgi:hypothetical protein